tara:strand:+ start:85 stop:1086 length:1002 start_codon:yes stop_codon:yes gene_type:complete
MTRVNDIKNYFTHKVGPMASSVDLGSADLKNPTNLQNFQIALGAPALSNYFKVSMELAAEKPEKISQFPGTEIGKNLFEIRDASDDKRNVKCNNLNQWLTTSGVFGNSPYGYQKFELLANEAMLPGTNMSVVQEVGSRQGIRERFATQRQYTDISIGFYVTNDYTSLRLFQEWINYMNPLYTGNGGAPYETSGKAGYPDAGSFNSFHRFRYPRQYKRDIQITKFERDLTLTPFNKPKNRYSANLGPSYTDIGIGPNRNNPNAEEFKNTPDVISYNFVNAFPISIQDIPLSYGNGQVLQVQVDFSYDRYYIVQTDDVNKMAEVDATKSPKIIKN